MRLILSIFLFAALIFGNQKITNPETGEEISLYNKSWAVIIGVNKYEHVKPLDYCVADANSIESLLIENFDFNSDNVIMLTNQEATLQGIRNAFAHIMKEAGKDDRVLIYFAGHGFEVNLVSSTGFLIGFLSFSGNMIPTGSDILLRLSFSDYTAGTLSCINDIILSDSSANEADSSYYFDQNNNCITIEE